MSELQIVLAKARNVKQNGDGYICLCPNHDDTQPSLSFKEGKNGRVIFNCFAGCDYRAIRESFGLANGKQEPVAIYDYTDERGHRLFQKLRYEPKRFLHRRPDGRGGWKYDLKGVRRVLYRLPELLEADPSITIFLCEGEKDADRLAALGAIATTNTEGASKDEKAASKWRDEYTETLRGRHVCILPDDDEAGRGRAEKVARALHGVAASVRIVRLPVLTEEKGYDASDYLNAGGTIEELYKLTEAAPLYAPPDDATRDGEDVDKQDAAPPNEQKQAARLIEIARQAELWHTPTGDVYATIANESVLLDSKEFRQWLEYSYWRETKTPPTAKAVNETLGVLSNLARDEGTKRDIHTRLAAHDGANYLDLCDDARRVVRISADGWQIINAKDAPVRFRRANGMLALPVPVAGGEAKLLRRFVNVAGDDDFTLLLAWLIAALRADAMKYPVLSLTGEQGSAKSTVTLLLRSLIDPNIAPLRNSVRNQWDATLAASNAWCVALNNLSDLPQWLSDTLCCIADGIGFASRTHHSMNEETIFQAARPIILNGISDIATRADLLDRAVCLHLPAIPASKRVADAVLFREYEEARPLILGGLLNAVCATMRNLPNVKLDGAPRMADFAQWATAAEGGLGLDAGAFTEAYARNREAANEAALEASTVATALLAFMRDRDGREIEITLSHLLDTLRARAGGDKDKPPPDFPKTTRQLAAELRRCAPNLRAVGCHIRHAGRENGKGARQRRISFEV